MRAFITGLQFLTTIRLWPESTWTPEGFGRSVRYFPFVGAVIGLAMVGAYLLLSPWVPLHLLAAMLVLCSMVLTGGLHCDGFMDSMDGLFSGRSPERMLEIMKDSRVGANGVMAFVCLLLIKWSIFLDFPASALSTVLFAAPVAGRIAMVIAITAFPYARPQGIGKAFAQFAGTSACMYGGASGLAILGMLGWSTLAAGLIGILFGVVFAIFANTRLGGLTGDIYGAVTEIAELCSLVAGLLLVKIFG